MCGVVHSPFMSEQFPMEAKFNQGSIDCTGREVWQFNKKFSPLQKLLSFGMRLLRLPSHMREKAAG